MGFREPGAGVPQSVGDRVEHRQGDRLPEGRILLAQRENPVGVQVDRVDLGQRDRAELPCPLRTQPGPANCLEWTECLDDKRAVPEHEDVDGDPAMAQ